MATNLLPGTDTLPVFKTPSIRKRGASVANNSPAHISGFVTKKTLKNTVSTTVFSKAEANREAGSQRLAESYIPVKNSDVTVSEFIAANTPVQTRNKPHTKGFCIDKSKWITSSKKFMSANKIQASAGSVEDFRSTAASPKSSSIEIPTPKSAGKSTKADTAASTPTSQSKETDSKGKNGPFSIVVKRRSPVKKLKPQLETKDSFEDMFNASSGATNSAQDYFLRHIRACGDTHSLYLSNEAALGESLRFNHLYFDNNHRTLNYMKYDTIVERPKTVNIDRKYPDRKLLLLDLDETLIHCTGDLSQMGKFDMEVDFINQDGIPLTGLLNVRPGARQFLERMAEHFEVAIFTASMKYYADRILRIIDPRKQFISHVFYRESCAKTRYEKLVKDLTVFGNVPLKDMILVDNNMYCMWPQPSNGVPILNFEHDRNDKELPHLEAFLISIKESNHVDHIRDHFQTHKVQNYESVKHYYATIGNFTNSRK